ncbi:hypothetical protein SeMB42_g04178 [Synchytrium endobioticum]|uniref:DUF4536 domain-containing protein n=1 Tax=Synchytrium endobioticum TaxID=286115 RepID=A0A507D069_9FUNG|nr:hypothetical protein SeMB42_g04178 [Synchytrium endobioticum]TPX50189.1 hypothetical protein SeLEV6574_g01047 [Synchytrium endobioticum]
MTTASAHHPSPSISSQSQSQSQSSDLLHYNDCMPCRLTGFVTMTGVGAYLWYEQTRVPPSPSSHSLRLLLRVMSGCFLALGTTRLLWKRDSSPALHTSSVS